MKQKHASGQQTTKIMSSFENVFEDLSLLWFINEGANEQLVGSEGSGSTAGLIGVAFTDWQIDRMQFQINISVPISV